MHGKKGSTPPCTNHAERPARRRGLCNSCLMMEKYWKDPVAARARVREWAKKHPDRVKEWATSYNRKNRVRIRDSNLRRLYGMTVEDYKAMFAAQGGLCAICRRVSDKISLNVDHDHETKSVRALLCHACNRGIGLFKESEETLLAAIEYLRKHRALKLAPVVEIKSK